jgi:predicted acylesterase/phospholipase RssA
MKSLVEALHKRNKDQRPISIIEVAAEFKLFRPFNLSTLIKLLERRLALVLGGGGSKGDFELGAIEYIYKRELFPDIIWFHRSTVLAQLLHLLCIKEF